MSVLRFPRKWEVWFGIALLLGLVLVLVACANPTPTAAPSPTSALPTPTSAPPAPTPEPEPTLECPFSEAWASSGHADATAEAFVHWDEDTPPEIPVGCAVCHSTPGYLDYLGADGTAAGSVENPAPVGTVITCTACHNEAAIALNTVTFPSGAEITGFGPSSRCAVCHQGRASTVTVNQAIESAAVASPDAVSADLRFINIHYFAAAATLFGGEVHGGYEYEGKSYDVKFMHVEGFDTCVDCHNSHTLELDLQACSDCHGSIASVEDLKDVRMQGSTVDYDGDGNVTEGIYYEVEGAREALYAAMQAYAKSTAGAAIAYDAAAYPYWFTDTNGNGQVDPDEANGDNAYKSWTARLLKAAYNYHTSIKDPGAFAHNAKYVIQFLYDSTEDLDTAAVGNMTRNDVGHFDGSAEAWRHWDGEGEVPGDCARCHSAQGLPLYIHEGVNISEPISNGMLCTTCHSDLTTFARYEVEQVKFPSGATLAFENLDANLCLNCHQGRESTVSINRAVQGLPVDEISEKLRFINPHYFAAGATLFGGEAMGAYQYDDKEYVGRFTHVAGFDSCVACHSAHGLEVNVTACAGCHTNVKTAADLETIRLGSPDYDGDGNTTEGVADDIATMHEALYAAMQAYAKEISGSGIVFSSNYPYWFKDTNGNGQADPDEAVRDNAYASWTPRLLKAAYNYQYVSKDPGAFAHNAEYIAQVLYDGLQDLGNVVTVDISKMTRP